MDRFDEEAYRIMIAHGCTLDPAQAPRATAADLEYHD